MNKILVLAMAFICLTTLSFAGSASVNSSGRAGKIIYAEDGKSDGVPKRIGVDPTHADRTGKIIFSRKIEKCTGVVQDHEHKWRKMMEDSPEKGYFLSVIRCTFKCCTATNGSERIYRGER